MISVLEVEVSTGVPNSMGGLPLVLTNFTFLYIPDSQSKESKIFVPLVPYPDATKRVQSLDGPLIRPCSQSRRDV